MSITCPQCSYINPDNSGFCVRCGNRLPQTGQFSSTSSSPSQSAFFSSPPAAPTSPYSTPSAPSFPPSNQSPAFPADRSSSSLPPPQWPTTMQPPPPPGTPMGAAQGLGSLRRAFAGFGTLVMHHSWLLTGDHAQALAIRSSVRDKLRQRNVVKLNVNASTLTERGILMEEREYVIAHRGVSTVFIYVAPAGQDLYISRATTVLPAISNLRVVILALLAVIMIIGFTSQPSIYTLYSAGIAAFLLASIFSALSYPILLLFIALLIRSFINWLVEKDFWRLLRPNVLNDFQLDDIALLEHVTDDVVRDAVDQAGLDASKIVPPALGYQPKPKIRAI